MSQESTHSFADIVLSLKKICDERRTGILYVTSDDNRSAQLMIDQGNIVYLYYFNKRGRDALRLLPEIKSGRFRFQEGSIPALRTDLPETEDMLLYLSGVENLKPAAAGSLSSRQPANEDMLPQSAVMRTLTRDQKRILEEGLAIYIGPMAAILCEEYLEAVDDVKTAVELLAAEIPAKEHAGRFRDEMLTRMVG